MQGISRVFFWKFLSRSYRCTSVRYIPCSGSVLPLAYITGNARWLSTFILEFFDLGLQVFPVITAFDCPYNAENYHEYSKRDSENSKTAQSSYNHGKNGADLADLFNLFFFCCYLYRNCLLIF